MPWILVSLFCMVTPVSELTPCYMVRTSHESSVACRAAIRRLLKNHEHRHSFCFEE